jgi:hypothetical protein
MRILENHRSREQLALEDRWFFLRCYRKPIYFDTTHKA